MKEKDPHFNQTSGKTLNWILALAITLVACATGWVGWICIDSVQKHAGKLNNYHVTADNTKIDSHHYDVVKNDIDSKIFSDQLSPSLELQNLLVKQEGSEIVFSKGVTAVDKKQYPEAAANFSQVLAMIPVEAKDKTSWFVYGGRTDRPTYTMWALRQRSRCYQEMGHYSPALVDVNEAVRLRPDTPVTYQKRAGLYYLLGKRALGDADMKTARAIMVRDPRPQYP